jgi:hypothetical protein
MFCLELQGLHGLYLARRFTAGFLFLVLNIITIKNND